jgi:hypothetical protein
VKHPTIPEADFSFAGISGPVLSGYEDHCPAFFHFGSIFPKELPMKSA